MLKFKAVLGAGFTRGEGAKTSTWAVETSTLGYIQFSQRRADDAPVFRNKGNLPHSTAVCAGTMNSDVLQGAIGK